MRVVFTLTVFLFYLALALGQTEKPTYDSTLAKSLGADEYGMKSYVFVILKTGSNKTTDRTYTDSCFSGHLKNIKRMVDSGDLIISGPFWKNENSYRGIFILNVKTIEEANRLLQTDPAINANLLEVELYTWYGSAALSEYLKIADKISLIHYYE